MPDEKAPVPAPFWRSKTMGEMTKAEWESLCDGCGRCCLNKLIDEDTNRTVFTDVGCRLLDGDTCERQRVAFFFKQWGGKRKKKTGRMLGDRTYDEYPSVSAAL